MSNIRLRPTEEDYKKMPYLDSILNDVETFVASKINEYDAMEHQVLIRRFILGKIGRGDDVNLFEKFKRKSEAPVNEWLATVALEKEECDKRHEPFLFKKDMKSAKRKYATLETDKDFKAKVVKKMEDMEAKRKDDSIGAKVEKYNKDVKDMKHNARAMFKNYGTSVIVAGANALDNMAFFPPFVASSGNYDGLIVSKRFLIPSNEGKGEAALNKMGMKGLPVLGTLQSVVWNDSPGISWLIY